MSMRRYPALEVVWPARPDDAHVERLLAAIDDDHPTAVESRPDGFRVFFASPDARARAAIQIVGADPSAACNPLDISDDDWAERSQEALGPVRVGRLVIAPPWNVPEASPPAIVIQPSMGFGTGHHASTRLCLDLLQTIPVAAARVLDVGTGSGVLALAAWRLGASAVTAIDSDADALAAARDNLARNLASGSISLRHEDLAADAGAPGRPRFDLLLANLTGETLRRCAHRLRDWAAPAGRLIVSGVLAEEETGVVAALTSASWRVDARAAEDDWVALVLSATTPRSPRAR